MPICGEGSSRRAQEKQCQLVRALLCLAGHLAGYGTFDTPLPRLLFLSKQPLRNAID